MNVLLSGSHGFIGGSLTRQLGDEGHRTTALVRGEAPTGAVTWDPAAGTLDRRALQERGPYDAVVNLAGAGIGDRRWTKARKAELRASRLCSTRVLVGALRSLDPVPPVLVNASAVGYYGDRGGDDLDETSSPGRGFLAELCREWEAEASKARDVTRVVLLRSGMVLSPTGGALRRLLPLFRLGLGGRLGDGRQYVSWITLRDELAVVRRAIDDPRVEGPVNATSPSPVTNTELTATLGRVLHRPAVLAVPRSALALALGRELVSEMLLASQRALPERLTALGHRFADPDLDAALTAVLG